MVARLLPLVLAFAVTLGAMSAYSYFADTRPHFPPDSLVVSASGHIEEARSAFRAAHLPSMRIVEQRAVGHASFASAVTRTTGWVAGCLLVFGSSAVIFRRLFLGTPTI